MFKTKYSNLRVEMIRKNELQKDVCKILGITKSTLSKRFAGTTEWTIGEIDKLCKHYNKDYYYLFNKNEE